MKTFVMSISFAVLILALVPSGVYANEIEGVSLVGTVNIGGGVEVVVFISPELAEEPLQDLLDMAFGLARENSLEDGDAITILNIEYAYAPEDFLEPFVLLAHVICNRLLSRVLLTIPQP